MTMTSLIWTVVKIAVMVGFVFNVAGLLTWYDRRGGAMMQDRIGPNRASLKIFGFELRIAGLLHTAADGVKFFTKEDFMPPKADKLLFSLAPMLAMIPVLVLLAVIPFGDTISTDLLWKHVCFSDGGVEFAAPIARVPIPALNTPPEMNPSPVWSKLSSAHSSTLVPCALSEL